MYSDKHTCYPVRGSQLRVYRFYIVFLYVSASKRLIMATSTSVYLRCMCHRNVCL